MSIFDFMGVFLSWLNQEFPKGWVGTAVMLWLLVCYIASFVLKRTPPPTAKSSKLRRFLYMLTVKLSQSEKWAAPAYQAERHALMLPRDMSVTQAAETLGLNPTTAHATAVAPYKIVKSPYETQSIGKIGAAAIGAAEAIYAILPDDKKAPASEVEAQPEKVSSSQIDPRESPVQSGATVSPGYDEGHDQSDPTDEYHG